MNLQFDLDYQTTFGEELMLNITRADGLPKGETHKMLTHDGKHWACDVEWNAGTGKCIDYHYSVRRGGDTTRREWLVAPHRLSLCGCAETYTIYDRWIDIPEDAYLYSSALTDCISMRRQMPMGPTGCRKAAILKVRAPQLRLGERLALAGSDDMLGHWMAEQAVEMTETQPNEWSVCLDADRLAGPAFDFKFVILNDQPDQETLWEGGFNRRITLPRLRDGEAVVYELPEALFEIYAWKCAGTVVPVFSLRSEGSFGVGDFGDLKLMIDWVDKTRQRALQILPVNDTTITHTWTDSYPYKCISIYALHPQYADFRQLPPLHDEARRKHYAALQKELNALPQIDYERVINAKMAYLHELFSQEGERMMAAPEYREFFDRNKDWLVPYAAFCHYRDRYGTATFSAWPDHRQMTADDNDRMGRPDGQLYAEAAFWYFVQYILDQQLRSARDHAHSHRVILKGDIPIGVSRDSVETWTEPQYFNMNGQAGAPPDAFSVNGQNWGFPTYNWEVMMADGCNWWMKRFRKMAEYFDAYRIDHVLGFFRIWEIPADAVHGLLGQFAPALAMTRSEIEAYGLKFQEELFTRPFITDPMLDRLFKEHAAEVRSKYLLQTQEGRYCMKPEYDTQRKVEAAFKGKDSDDDRRIRNGLYSLISDVLFLHDHKRPDLFHPRVGVQNDFVYASLCDHDKEAFNRLYDDFYYRRNNQFWYGEGMKKLERLTQATRMLVCAEDLGMVPDCVPWVMNQLRILTLEIQTMPKKSGMRFAHLSENPYRSVCTISTHDMPTLRQWWDEDRALTQEYYATRLYHEGNAPHPLPGWLAQDIVMRHLSCPSMLCLLSLQDWLSINEKLRLPDENGERINIPANPRHYWRYRMHLTIEQLLAADELNDAIATMITESDRK